MGSKMDKWHCTISEYVFDGDALPEAWLLCGSSSGSFEPYQQ